MPLVFSVGGQTARILSRRVQRVKEEILYPLEACLDLRSPNGIEARLAGFLPAPSTCDRLPETLAPSS